MYCEILCGDSNRCMNAYVPVKQRMFSINMLHFPSADSSVNVNYVGKILDGFTLSIKPLLQKKIYFPPILPPGFRPVHRFKKTPQQLVMESIGECSHDGSQKYNKSKLNAVERGLMLGEKPIAREIVFSLYAIHTDFK